MLVIVVLAVSFDLDSSTLGMFPVLLTSSSSFSAFGSVPCCDVDDDADGKTFSFKSLITLC